MKGRLPAAYGLRFYVEASGLMSDAPDTVDMFRRSAVFIDKILKEPSPATCRSSNRRSSSC